jgi:uncharacterized membrane protein
MNDVIDVSPAAPKDGLDPERDSSLRTIGHISYGLHAVVAVSAVLPGVQASVLLLLVAFILDMVKKSDAAGTWQESHFSWRIRTVLWAGMASIWSRPGCGSCCSCPAGSPGH